jgi:quercetin dioxygenase-like cupin family protein
MEAGGERVVKAGESWTEKPGDLHAVANRSAGTIRIVATYLIPKGAGRTTIVK